MFLPLLMYSGAGRYILTTENKRKIIKMAQAQEILLHTLPLGALIIYNNLQNVKYNEELEEAVKAIFPLSAILTLIELFYGICQTARGEKPEVIPETKKSRISGKFIKSFGFCTVLLTVVVIVIPLSVYEELACQKHYFVDEQNLCKSCTLYFGDECIECESSAKCSVCKSGYFFALEDDPVRGIVAATEKRCRPCQENFGQYCTACTQNECTASISSSSFINASTGSVIECSSIPNCVPDSCDSEGCTECTKGYYLDDSSRECHSCSSAITHCEECSSGTQCTKCSAPFWQPGSSGSCVCDPNGKLGVVLNESTGACECENPTEFMHETHGCHNCNYLLPGCTSCETVRWDTGIPLDSTRLGQ